MVRSYRNATSLRMKRKSADWMSVWDDRILELLREEGPNSPTPISKHKYIHVTASQVSRRLRRLAEYGLVEPYPNGVYGITTDGEFYLDGELDASTIGEEDDNKENGDAHAEA
ncbi:ArsR family transcriptional regulator [Halobellus inordinatus]|uniref:ArsR family transcriptional regulator n=1 Tax=Halobellus inordinatus TaxID=1126236 RepID=UPI002114AEF8|nr:ArsR family transcriptional regulator [Halobellus ramosii]